MRIIKSYAEWPKRGRRFINHRVETIHQVKIEGDTAWRRVYEVWENGKAKGWYIFVKQEPVKLTITQKAVLNAVTHPECAGVRNFQEPIS